MQGSATGLIIDSLTLILRLETSFAGCKIIKSTSQIISVFQVAHDAGIFVS